MSLPSNVRKNREISDRSQVLLLVISIVCLGTGVVLFLLAAEKFKTPRITLLSYPTDVEGEIVNLLNSANESIDVGVYIFTNERLARSLADAKARGVNVRVILGDDKGEEVQDIISILSMVGIPFRVGADKFEIMHAKYAIIDSKIVLIGSHNWTRSAMVSNREISIIIEDAELALKLQAIFESDWYS